MPVDNTATECPHKERTQRYHQYLTIKVIAPLVLERQEEAGVCLCPKMISLKLRPQRRTECHIPSKRQLLVCHPLICATLKHTILSES